MNIPTIDEALAALDANPEAARAFEKSRAIESPGMSRREAVAQTLEALRAKRAATASAATTGELKARAKQAAAGLERAAEALRQSKAATPAPKPQANFMQKPPLPAKAPTITASHTAASFATPAVTMTRGEFNKLSEADKIRFAKSKGRLV